MIGFAQNKVLQHYVPTGASTGRVSITSSIKPKSLASVADLKVSRSKVSTASELQSSKSKNTSHTTACLKMFSAHLCVAGAVQYA